MCPFFFKIHAHSIYQIIWIIQMFNDISKNYDIISMFADTLKSIAFFKI